LSQALAAALEGSGYSVLYTRWTMASAKDSIIPEFTEKLDMTGARGRFDVQINEIRHARNGSKVLFRGIKTSSGNQTAKLKSLQGLNVWVLDEAEEMPDEKTFDVIDLSIRDKRRPNLVILCLNPVHKRHWIYRRFIEGKGIPDAGFSGVVGDTTYIHSDYRDNWANLPASYRDKATASKAGDPRQYKSIWLGAWMDEVQGALWDWGMIADHRIEPGEPLPDMVRVVVAIDPSVSSTGHQDEVGIVVVGKGTDGHFYVLGDVSGTLTPNEWAREALRAYDLHKADCIVGEVNNGGDLVEINLRTVRRDFRFIKVTASRGKITRAQPIASLYSEGLVHHIGRFMELESEMMSYTGNDGQPSPGRLDACFVAGTMITTSMGLIPIERVKAGDYVLTRAGYHRVLVSEKTRESAEVLTLTLSCGICLTCSLDHPIWVNQKGWTESCKIEPGQFVELDWLSASYLMESNTSDISLNLTQKKSISDQCHQGSSQEVSNSILRFGKRSTARYLKENWFTIKTAIRSITCLRTYAVYLEKSTQTFIESRMMKWLRGWITPGCTLQNGTEAKPELLGTQIMGAKHGLEEIESTKRSAIVAENCLSLFSRSADLHCRFAPASASIGITKETRDTLSTGRAKCAENSLRSGLTENSRHVLARVVLKSGAGMQDVYNLHVENQHEYYANGVLVHNCVWALSELSGVDQVASSASIQATAPNARR
jgi:hypothetical protein